VSIRQALAKLEKSVGKLESSAVQLETSMAGEQRDMFGAVIKKNGTNGNGNGHALQGALFAKRLDQAIEQVEEILKE
jgi:exonuclease VII small subunit